MANQPDPATKFPHSTPRLYGSCTLFDNNSGTITFTSKILGTNRLFRATLDLDPGSNLPVFVKLVPGSYGVEVYRFLETKHLAPALYGYSKVDGAPIAYIMEYLDPSECQSTLHELIHFGDALPSDARLRESLRNVLDALESRSYVHGDLRPNNFMVGIDEAMDEIEFKVIDFDWAGEAGEVITCGAEPLNRRYRVAWEGWRNYLPW